MRGELGFGDDEDVSKVVIVVEGCDKDILDYLFNVIRLIKGCVKMEIIMWVRVVEYVGIKVIFFVCI